MKMSTWTYYTELRVTRVVRWEKQKSPPLSLLSVPMDEILSFPLTYKVKFIYTFFITILSFQSG